MRARRRKSSPRGRSAPSARLLRSPAPRRRIRTSRRRSCRSSSPRRSSFPQMRSSSSSSRGWRRSASTSSRSYWTTRVLRSCRASSSASARSATAPARTRSGLAAAAWVVLGGELREELVQRPPFLGGERSEELLLDPLRHGAQLVEAALAVGCQPHEVAAAVVLVALALCEAALLEVVEDADELAPVVPERVCDLGLRLPRTLIEERENAVVEGRESRRLEGRVAPLFDVHAEALEQEAGALEELLRHPLGDSGCHRLNSVARPMVFLCYRGIYQRSGRSTVDGFRNHRAQALECPRSHRHRAVHGHPRRRDRERGAPVDPG